MSNRLKQLRDKKAEVLSKAEAITDKAEKAGRLVLDDAEKKTHGDLIAEARTYSEEIEREETVLAEKARSSKSVLGSERDVVIAGDGNRATAFSSMRTQTSVALKSIGTRDLIGWRGLPGSDPYERALRCGHFFLAAIWGNAKSLEFCSSNGIPVAKAQSEGVATAGGLFVPEEVAFEIITLRDSYGMARRLCRPWPMGSDRTIVPRWKSGLTAYPVGEGVAITASEAAWVPVGLTARKWGVLVLMSSEVDEDAAIALGDYLVGEMAYALANTEDSCWLSGDGTSTYNNIVGLRKIFNDGVGLLAGSVDAASGHDTMAEIDAVDLAAVQGKLPQFVYERGRPVWLCSQTMWANVFERLIGASGGVTKDQASGRTLREYNGYPVEISPAMLAPAAPTTNCDDVAMILFGDPAMTSMFGSRRGMTVSRSTEYKFAEDQIALKATERFDINNHGTGSTTAAGAMVALMGE